jgi:hypothetical protein
MSSFVFVFVRAARRARADGVRRGDRIHSIDRSGYPLNFLGDRELLTWDGKRDIPQIDSYKMSGA